MRNYIILNGTNSNTITGLLISTLPPITKPKQRTQTEEIDGRDGDIVTKLGYSAYDKEFEIGLYGSYDINEVISFFNSEGTVVFSNESDKYYKYQIIDQIDYEKLIRFKTATVTMHMQPFKYPTTESTITISGETTVTNTGNTYATPVLNITGSGTIEVTLNGIDIFSIDLGENSTQITIDITNMEAYNPDTTALMNRQVTGDYSLFKILSGSNTVELSGSVTSATISNYTRWL
jgi:phage-related protein